jgi:hypothetical protein
MTAKKRWNFTRYSSLLKGFADLVSDITDQEPKKVAILTNLQKQEKYKLSKSSASTLTVSASQTLFIS